MKSVLTFIFAVIIVCSLALPASFLGAFAVDGATDSAYVNPDTTGLYGGLIYWIEVIDLGDNKSRAFISTQSANSIFYTDIDHSADDPYSNVTWQVIPDLNADAGFGNIPMFTADENSGWIYFSWWPEDMSPMGMDDSDTRVPGLYKCNVEEGSLTSLEEESKDSEHHGPGRHISSSLFAHDGYLFFIEREEDWENAGPDTSPEEIDAVSYLVRITIDPETGDLVGDETKVKITDDRDFWPSWENGIILGSEDNSLYILNRGDHHGGYDTEGSVMKTLDAYNEIDSSTDFLQIPLPTMNINEGWSDSWWNTMGVAPDGRIILLGWAQLENYGEPCVAYTDDSGQNWTTHARDREEDWWGNPGPNMVFVGTADSYTSYCGTMISENNGETWSYLGQKDQVPIWGGNPTETDPNNPNTFYLPTHEGIAVSTDAGYSFSRKGGLLEITDAANPWDVWFEDMAAASISSTITRIIVNQRYWKDQDNWDWMNQGQAFYYMDVDYSGDTTVFSDFQSIPNLTSFASSEHSRVNQFVLDSSTGYIYFEGERKAQNGDWWECGLFRCTVDSEIQEVTQQVVAEWDINHGGTWEDGHWANAVWVNDQWEGGEPQWMDGHWKDNIEPSWVDGYKDENDNWIDGYWDYSDCEWIPGYWDSDNEWIEGQWVGGTTILQGETFDEILHARAPLIYNGTIFFTEPEWSNDGEWVDETYDENGNHIPGHWESGVSTYLCHGSIDENGSFSKSGRVQIREGELNTRSMVINPYNNLVYILDEGAPWMYPPTEPAIYKSSDTYDALSENTTFEQISLPEPATDTDQQNQPPKDQHDGGYFEERYEWRVLQCAPDGRLFVSGERQGMNWEQVIAYSADEGEEWTVSAIEWEVGQPGRNFGFLGSGLDYEVVCGNVISLDKGVTWKSMPRADDTKATPNAAVIKIDPNNSEMLYVPTTKGIGASIDGGSSFFDINEGVEAVQIRGLVLDPESGCGWSVAKSGIRKVYNFETEAEWSLPMDPAKEDWTWYDTVAMDLSDDTGNTAYVGTRWGDAIYKTTDGGENWKRFHRPEPDYEPPLSETNEDWHNRPHWEGQVSAIKVDPYNNSNRIFIGYNAEHFWMPPNSEDVQIPYGQLWMMDSDSYGTWTQIILRNDEDTNNTSIGNEHNTFMKGDVNIIDILITQENDKTVLYIAAQYLDETASPVQDEERWNSNGRYDHNTGLPYVNKIYRVEETGNDTWDITEDLAQEDLAITALAIDSKGTVYAAGKDYDEDTYQKYIDDYMVKAREEMVEKRIAEERKYFESEAEDALYDELVVELFDEGTGADLGGDDWDGHFYEVYREFYDEYFADYADISLDDDFETYYTESFEEFFVNWILPEYEKHTEDMDDQFDDYWMHNMPQQGLKTVYKKTVDGDWEALPLKGLNKSFQMHHNFDFNKEVLAVGGDPIDATNEVPYIAFNRFIYYLPDDAAEWVLGIEYAAGTEIYTMVGITSSTSPGAAALPGEEADGSYVYVGTGTGMYGQYISVSIDYEKRSEGTGVFGSMPLILIVGIVVGAAVIGVTGTFLIRRKLCRGASMNTDVDIDL